MDKDQRNLQDDTKGEGAVSPAAQPAQQKKKSKNVLTAMPRPILRGVILGFAFGYILQGVFGLLGLHIDGLMIDMVCMGLGWFISKKLYERQQAAEKAAAVEVPVQEDEQLP